MTHWRPGKVAVDLTREEADRLEALLPVGDPVRDRIHTATHPEKAWVCEDCGSTAVEYGVWVDANGNVTGDSTGEGRSNNWCPVCKDHVGLDTVTSNAVRIP